MAPKGNGTRGTVTKGESPADTPPGESPILDVPQLAQLLSLSEWKVRAWTAAGVIPHWRSGVSIYYHRVEVLHWWQEGRKAAGSAPASDLAQLLLDGELELVIVPR